MERIEEKQFPDNLEDRLAIIANAINTELKTATLLHLDDAPREDSEIRARIGETIGEGYLPETRAFSAYGNTLYNIALVAKKTITRDTGEVQYIGYSLTEIGKTLGLPVAVFSLRYAVDNKISMFNILGSTASRGDSRAPYNRIRILRKLRNSKELRRVDLIETLDLDDQSVQTHLEALSKIGFVEFESTGTKPKGKFKYQWIKGNCSDEIKSVGTLRSLTRKVAKILAENDNAYDGKEISKIFGYKSPEDISRILCGLEKQALVERVLPWKAHELCSRIRILDNGRKFYDKWYLPLSEILAGNALEIFRKESESFRESPQYPEYVKKGIELYKEVSPQINRKFPEDRMKEIRVLLSNRPGIPVRKIAEDLSASFITINRYIRKLKKELRKEKEGHEIIYFLVALE